MACGGCIRFRGTSCRIDMSITFGAAGTLKKIGLAQAPQVHAHGARVLQELGPTLAHTTLGSADHAAFFSVHLCFELLQALAIPTTYTPPHNLHTRGHPCCYCLSIGLPRIPDFRLKPSVKVPPLTSFSASDNVSQFAMRDSCPSSATASRNT